MRQRLNDTVARVRRRRRKLLPYKEKSTTYSKTLTSALVVMASAWISWSYILATVALVQYGNVDPLTTLSIEVCKTIIGTVIVYGAKALFENVSKYSGAGGENSTDSGNDMGAEG